MTQPHPKQLGNRLAPTRFVIFCLLYLAAAPLASLALGWRQGVMLGFDLAAGVFLLSLIPLFRSSDADAMRRHARDNDANRFVLLVITGIIMVAILVSVASELSDAQTLDARAIALVIATLALAWLFSNMVYALHYAHLFYAPDDGGEGDRGGIDIPGTNEPDYGDFVYFSYTLGMTFQTSDVAVSGPHFRRIAILHCLVAFVFNIGVLAFTINVLGGA